MLSATSAVDATNLILASRRCQVTVHKHSTLAEYDRIHDDVHDWLREMPLSTLDEFCERHRYSRRSVQRALASFGITWRQVVLKNRMMTAADLLANTDDAISSIALEVGYNSLSLFGKHFTNYFGETPLVWRRLERRKNGAKPTPA